MARCTFLRAHAEFMGSTSSSKEHTLESMLIHVYQRNTSIDMVEFVALGSKYSAVAVDFSLTRHAIRSCEYMIFTIRANIHRIVRILLMQFGKCPLKVLYTDLLLFRVYLHCFSMQEAANAFNLTYFWDNWWFRFSRKDSCSSQLPKGPKNGLFRGANTWNVIFGTRANTK